MSHAINVVILYIFCSPKSFYTLGPWWTGWGGWRDCDTARDSRKTKTSACCSTPTPTGGQFSQENRRKTTCTSVTSNQTSATTSWKPWGLNWKLQINLINIQIKLFNNCAGGLYCKIPDWGMKFLLFAKISAQSLEFYSEAQANKVI